jgi:hypothetical protein
MPGYLAPCPDAPPIVVVVRERETSAATDRAPLGADMPGLGAALGVDFELFTGVPDESSAERSARLDAAVDVLADLERDDPAAALVALELMRTASLPLRRPAIRVRPAARFAEVA